MTPFLMLLIYIWLSCNVYTCNMRLWHLKPGTPFETQPLQSRLREFKIPLLHITGFRKTTIRKIIVCGNIVMQITIFETYNQILNVSQLFKDCKGKLKNRDKKFVISDYIFEEAAYVTYGTSLSSRPCQERNEIYRRNINVTEYIFELDINITSRIIRPYPIHRIHRILILYTQPNMYYPSIMHTSSNLLF